jgi:hypothetical protein
MLILARNRLRFRCVSSEAAVQIRCGEAAGGL